MKRFSAPRSPRRLGWNKPQLEALELRSLPGETLLGGLALGVLGGTALAWQGQADPAPKVALTQGLANTPVQSSTNQAVVDFPTPPPNYQNVVTAAVNVTPTPQLHLGQSLDVALDRPWTSDPLAGQDAFAATAATLSSRPWFQPSAAEVRSPAAGEDAPSAGPAHDLAAGTTMVPTAPAADPTANLGQATLEALAVLPTAQPANPTDQTAATPAANPIAPAVTNPVLDSANRPAPSPVQGGTVQSSFGDNGDGAGPLSGTGPEKLAENDLVPQDDTTCGCGGDAGFSSGGVVGTMAVTAASAAAAVAGTMARDSAAGAAAVAGTMARDPAVGGSAVAGTMARDSVAGSRGMAGTAASSTTPPRLIPATPTSIPVSRSAIMTAPSNSPFPRICPRQASGPIGARHAPGPTTRFTPPTRRMATGCSTPTSHF